MRSILIKNKKGFVKKVFSLLAISLLIFVLFISINPAEENSDLIEEPVDQVDLEETPPEESVEEPVDQVDLEETLPEEPIEEEVVEEESVEEPVDQVDPEETPPEESVEEPVEENLLEEEIIEEEMNDSGSLEESSSESSSEFNEEEVQKNPELLVEVSSLEKIVRGESFELKVNIKNIGEGEAKKVSIDWDLPIGFSLESKEKISFESISSNESIEFTQEFDSSFLAFLGKNEIKIKVGYKNE